MLNSPKKTTRVVADYADSFILLLVYHVCQLLICSVLLDRINHCRTTVQIKATVSKRQPNVLTVYVFLGCNTLAHLSKVEIAICYEGFIIWKTLNKVWQLGCGNEIQM